MSCCFLAPRQSSVSGNADITCSLLVQYVGIMYVAPIPNNNPTFVGKYITVALTAEAPKSPRISNKLIPALYYACTSIVSSSGADFPLVTSLIVKGRIFQYVNRMY